MKIIFASDLHFNKDKYNWFINDAPHSDLLVLGGDLLDQNHPAPQSRQVEWVSNWINNYPRQLCVCSGNHDRTWNSRTGAWEPATWLWELNTDKHRTRSGIVEINNVSILTCNFQEPIPHGNASIWISHYPPAGTAVALSSYNHADGDESLTRHIKQRKPKLLLCGHQHSPIHWHANLHQTLCINPGFSNDCEMPNYVSIDTDKATAHWRTNTRMSLYLEGIDTPIIQGSSNQFRNINPLKKHERISNQNHL